MHYALSPYIMVYVPLHRLHDLENMCGSGTTGRHPLGTRHKVHVAYSLPEQRENMKL